MSRDTVLITGAGGAIGTALCRAFRDRGYHIIGLDKHARPAGTHTELDWVECDLVGYVQDADRRCQVEREIQDFLRGGVLRVLINNAAVQRLAGIDDLSWADWQETLDVNVTAPAMLTKACLPHLERSKDPCVINIGSIHARLTKRGFLAYASSKAALQGLTQALAVDLGGRVRVNAVSPAAVDTPMLRAGFAKRPEALDELAQCHPVGRIGRPEEVAAAAMFLTEDGAAFASGMSLDLDGAIGRRLHDPP